MKFFFPVMKLKTTISASRLLKNLNQRIGNFMKKRNMALASARSIIHSTKIKQFLIISSISRLFLVRGNNSLAAKLVQVPLSRIKETLDSEEKIHFSTLKSQDFSWDGLVSALLSSSFPRKANLVSKLVPFLWVFFFRFQVYILG